MKKVLSILLSFCMLFSITVGIDFSASAASNPYAGGYNNCTYTVWEEVYNRHKIALPWCSNACNWLDCATSAGYSVYKSGTAKANSIAVWFDSGLGHVAYVTSVSGSTMTVVEGGWGDGVKHTTSGLSASIGSKRNYQTQTLAGYIVLSNSVPSTTPNISFKDVTTKSVTTNSATVFFRVNNPNNCTVTRFGVRIRKSGEGSWKEVMYAQTTSYTETNPWGEFKIGASSISGVELVYTISPGTKYEWQPLVVANNQKFYGNTMTFTTQGSSTSSSSHTHKYTTKTNITPATETKDGECVKISYCSTCGVENYRESYPIFKAETVELSKTSYTYDGKVKKPSLVLVDSSGFDILPKNYTVSYASDRKNVGKYSVTINFKGEYSGTKTLYFTIKPKATSISKVTAAKKAFTVKWKKQATQTTGYQIQYATNSAFTNNKKTVTVSNKNTVSKKISGVKAKKKYYVRVRTYKTVNGTKYYSSWSKAKTVTTKK